MKQISADEIGIIVGQLVIGASYSVDLMGFKDEPLFTFHGGVSAEEIMALTDERLPARAVFRRLEKLKIVRNYKDLIDPDGRMEEYRDRHWRIRIPPFLPPAHLLLVDNEVAIYADMSWSSKKDDSVYIVENSQEIETLHILFEASWSGEADLIYRDQFGGLTTVEEQQIITASADQWGQIIKDLAMNPKLLHSLPSRRFEELVAELLSRDGMNVQLTPAQKDGGRDILAYMNTPAGNHLFLVECKRYSPENPVGVRLVRELFGIVEHERATAGLLVTTSRFTEGALKFRDSIRHRMSLKDFEILFEWLKDHS